MLEQLVESRNNTRENKTRGGFLLTTFVLVAALCFSAVLWSLFAMNVGLGSSEFEISSLVAPIAPAEEKPAPPEPIEKNANQTDKAVSETTRQTNMLRIDEGLLIPDKISVVPNTQKERPKGAFIIKDGAEVTSNVSRGNFNREENKNGKNLGENTQPKTSDDDEEKFPVLEKKVIKEEKTPTTVSKGVITSQATSLPKPAYSAAAKSVKAAGDVSVQVTIDESGKVISAKAVTGHALLRAESERAARGARFTPTYLSGKAVKVTGIIIYKFSLQ